MKLKKGIVYILRWNFRTWISRIRERQMTLSVSKLSLFTHFLLYNIYNVRMIRGIRQSTNCCLFVINRIDFSLDYIILSISLKLSSAIVY